MGESWTDGAAGACGPASADDERFMRVALDEARAAAAEGEVPIGAVVVHDGRVIARAHNRREQDADPAAHAEFSAMLAAARALGRWRLTGCTVYVTLEPCTMCAGLMVNARVSRCVYGAADPKGGALGTLYRLNADNRLNHAFSVTPGVLGDECAAVLQEFFAGLRRKRGATSEGASAQVASLSAGAGCAPGADAPIGATSGATSGTGAVSPGQAPEAPHVGSPAPRVLLALDSFKGSATSAEVEAWVEEGVLHTCPDARVVKLPLADGGEGTLDAVAAALGGERVTCEVAGPLDEPVCASYLLTDGPAGRLAVIEMAEAAGIGYSPCTHAAALRASTRGVGELVRDAVARGARTLYLGLGGSATSDGGAGLLQALGAHVRDAAGREVGPGLAGLEHVASVDLGPARELLRACELVILSDVGSPLVGRRGALAVYGAQKGLRPCGPAEEGPAEQGVVAGADGRRVTIPERVTGDVACGSTVEVPAAPADAGRRGPEAVAAATAAAVDGSAAFGDSAERVDAGDGAGAGDAVVGGAASDAVPGAGADAAAAGAEAAAGADVAAAGAGAGARRRTLEEYDRWMVAYGRVLDAARREADAAAPAGDGADGAGNPAAAPAGTAVARRFRSVLGVPGAGAAGGLAAALLTLGARLVSGADAILDLVGFDDALRTTDLLITGEGAMDAQTAQGKAPVCAARRAKRAQVPVVALVGGRADDLDAVYRAGIDLVLPIVRRPMPLERALTPSETRANLRAAGEAALRAYLLRGGAR